MLKPGDGVIVKFDDGWRESGKMVEFKGNIVCGISNKAILRSIILCA